MHPTAKQISLLVQLDHGMDLDELHHTQILTLERGGYLDAQGVTKRGREIQIAVRHGTLATLEAIMDAYRLGFLERAQRIIDALAPERSE